MVPPPEESRKKMKKYTLNITAAMLFALVTISPALVGSSCVAPKGEQEDTASTAIKKDLGITALKYSSPEVPASVIFCGKTIDSADTTAMSVWIANCWHLPICTAPPCK